MDDDAKVAITATGSTCPYMHRCTGRHLEEAPSGNTSCPVFLGPKNTSTKRHVVLIFNRLIIEDCGVKLQISTIKYIKDGTTNEKHVRVSITIKASEVLPYLLKFDIV